MFQNPTLFEKSFSLVKTAPEVRGCGTTNLRDKVI